MLAEKIGKHHDRMVLQDFEISVANSLYAHKSVATRITSLAAGEIAAAGSSVLAICAFMFYRIRELLAALLLFSVAIGAMFLFVVILWLAGEAAYEAASRIEIHVNHNPARHFLAWSRAHAAHIHWSPHWNGWM